MEKLQRGFTLIELSVVLLVIALVAGMGITLSQNVLSGSDRVTTQQRLTLIASTLDAYAKQNGFLPCPANRDAITSDAAFGLEQRVATPGAPPAARCTTSTTLVVAPSAGTPQAYIGAVPTQTLGLPSSYAADAWGNKFLYAVSYNHVLGQDSYFTQDGTITVKYGDSTTNYAITTQRDNTPGAGAVYVVLSHGANGLGAYPLNGTAQVAGCTGSGIDVENCNDTDATFFDTEFNDGATAAANFFDDYILWRSNKLNRAPADLTSGQAQGGSTTTIQLAATASSVTDAYVGATITITSGAGKGQSAKVTAYDGATKTATTSWITPPDATSQYSISTPTAGYGGGCAPGICETWCAPCFNQPLYSPDPSAANPMKISVCESSITSALPNCSAKCVYAYTGTGFDASGASVNYNIPCPMP